MFTLTQQPSSLDPQDAEGVRAALMERLSLEVKRLGQPHPRVVLVFPGREESLSLHEVSRGDPGADLGATFQALRARGADRRFLVLRMSGQDEATGEDRTFVVLFEELDGPRRWWVALQRYEPDEATGLARTVGEWSRSAFETTDPGHLWPFLHGFVSPPADARPAAFRPPPDRFAPKVRFVFGDLPEAVAAPTDPKQLADLALHLSAAGLLAGELTSPVIVRLVGRSWERWEVSDDLPAPIEEVMRWLANHREPAADGIALVLLAIRPEDDPPVPGLQAIGELGAAFAHAWAPIEFPEGPTGPKKVERIRWWEPRAVPEGGLWLGVRSTLDIEELTPEA